MNEREIYDMLMTGAMRDEIPATEQQIDDAIEMFEGGYTHYDAFTIAIGEQRIH